jgi:tetratricopeptide (TPR) repeat protein
LSLIASLVRKSARLTAGAFLLCGCLSGCALLIPQTEQLRQQWPADLPPKVELTEVPFFPQDEYQCGPAALATSLASFQVKVTPEELVEKVYIPARRGSIQVEMIAAPRRYGMVSYLLAPRFADLLREVAAGIPVIVLQDYGTWPIPILHYAVVVGYDAAAGEVVLRSGEKSRLIMPFGVFEYIWKDYWALITVPPDRIPATAEAARYLAAIAALEHAGDARTAAKAYDTFLARWPGDPGASIGLANAYYSAGDLAKTQAVLRAAAERHPDSEVVLNNLAQTLSDLGRNDEALDTIERAAALAGPHAADVQETRLLIQQRMRGTP